MSSKREALVLDIPNWFSDLGVELELGALFVLSVLGAGIFDRFEVETEIWRKLCRWAVAAALTLGLYFLAGHWALLGLALFALLGAAVHFGWCRKHGIHPIKAQPSEDYYHLRGWQWPPA